ncbi:MAG: CDF family Co(II)/Ni(II) efflux transporter DmeF [Syntrophobacteraceae bacterium]|jgi:cation diffusion facilitator family transporter|nr:CDF family Co(II)/Ni(II) efflux transporter DmeF [Syntrophobacteraceae bacterium]
MHIHSLDRWEHSHDFSLIHLKGERRTTQVLVITAVTMIIEIAAGQVYGSMALLADGWHMGTHVAAFGISVFAYHYARRHARNPRFSFGTGKVSVLGGFASAVGLAVVALMMAMESVARFFDQREIHYNEAIVVAVLGLAVNLACAALLQAHHFHDDTDDDRHETHQHHDHNLRAAYLHVLADALTSVLAIAALLSGKVLGWQHLDPLMGIVGAVVITRWSWHLLKETSSILLDSSGDEAVRQNIKARIENDADNRVADVHVWKVGPAHYSAMVSVVTHFPRHPDHYKKLMDGIERLHHLTVEVNPCESEPCIVPKKGA